MIASFDELNFLTYHTSVAIMDWAMKVGDRQTDRAFIKASTFYVINVVWKLKITIFWTKIQFAHEWKIFLILIGKT